MSLTWQIWMPLHPKLLPSKISCQPSLCVGSPNQRSMLVVDKPCFVAFGALCPLARMPTVSTPIFVKPSSGLELLLSSLNRQPSTIAKTQQLTLCCPGAQLQQTLRQMVEDAKEKGELWTRDWDTTPLPAVNGAVFMGQAPALTPAQHVQQARAQSSARWGALPSAGRGQVQRAPVPRGFPGRGAAAPASRGASPRGRPRAESPSYK